MATRRAATPDPHESVHFPRKTGLSDAQTGAAGICRTTRQVDIWRGLSTLRFTCAKSSLVLWTCKYVITCTVCVSVTACPWHQPAWFEENRFLMR